MSIEEKYGKPSGYGVDTEASIEELYAEALLLEEQKDELLKAVKGLLKAYAWNYDKTPENELQYDVLKAKQVIEEIEKEK